MAYPDFVIRAERRLCEVDGKLGYFHTWEHWSRVVEPSLMVGGTPGGVVGGVLGIVEFPDGVKEIHPTKIKFVDEENGFLRDMNDTCSFVKREDENNG